ncbi:MAG: acetoin utilization protein AcuC [Armatimonadetes bacterium]|nr:acetoin utilization protein AcuC [Armatimonadota bacterium]
MFFHDVRAESYDFGPQHPLRPERLSRTMALLRHVAPGLEVHVPPPATRADALRVHSEAYVEAVEALGADPKARGGAAYGFGPGDNPPFTGMYEAALHYSAAAAEGARRVADGLPLACAITGGLHHARREEASGFCIFNDPAIACSILRDRFDRVAYVDIDLHHGDGVQWIFYDDPSVLTYSVHESGRTLYPGTGFVRESGAGQTKVNVPLAAGTSGDVWADAVARTLPAALEAFLPQAVVFQTGADPHVLDPLGHLEVLAQDWLDVVRLVKSFGLPTVMVGGGGYERTTVPRMWTAAVLTMSGIDFDDRLGGPDDVLDDGTGRTYRLADLAPACRFSDDVQTVDRGQGRSHAEAVVQDVLASVISRMGRP